MQKLNYQFIIIFNNKNAKKLNKFLQYNYDCQDVYLINEYKTNVYHLRSNNINSLCKVFNELANNYSYKNISTIHKL